MTRILLLSDTHGHLDPKIFKYLKTVDEVWHAGDIGTIDVIDELKKYKPVRAVYGNIDGGELRTELKEHEAFKIEGVNILMTHIGGKPERYVRTAYPLIQRYRPQLFVCGHSHILLVKMDQRSNMLWMNPGACGYKGFHKVKTLLRFNIHMGKIQDLEVIELGNRI